jgi:hypothetical protein
MLVEALQIIGPCLSTELADYLVGTHGLTPEAARKRISRAASIPKVKRLAHLTFARKARFLYLESDFMSEQYWAALTQAIHRLGGAYSMALGAVEARGVVPVDQFTIICGCPIAQKKHLSAQSTLDRLVKANVLATQDIPGLGACVVPRVFGTNDQGRDSLIVEARSRLITEGILLKAARDWVTQLGMASWNKVECRDDPGLKEPWPKVGTFAWDLAGPSYMNALKWWKGDKLNPGFVVCDVGLHGRVGLPELKPFLHKCETLQQLRGIGKTIHIFIAERYTHEALLAAKTAGVLPATPDVLFGKGASAGFMALASVMKDLAQQTLHPEKFHALFEGLSQVEGAVGNIRGALFEMLVAEVVRRSQPNARIDLNRQCKGNDGHKAEVDVFVTVPHQPFRLIECKGNHPDVTLSDEEVSLWLDTRILRVRQYLDRTREGPWVKPIFELWHTGHLSTQAMKKITATQHVNRNKFDLWVYGPEKIREKVTALADHALINTFAQHFLPSLMDPHAIPEDLNDGRDVAA